MWQEVLQRAGTAAARKDWTEAERVLVAVAERPDTPAVVWFQLGKISFVQRKLDAAATWFRKATEAAPQVADGWFELGRTLGAANRHSEALPALRKATELAPDNAQAHRFAAHVARSQSDFETASHHFRALRALLPQDPEAWVDGYAAALEARDPEAESLREQLMADPIGRARCMQITVRCSAGRIPLAGWPA